MNIKDSINDLAASTFEEIQRVEKEYREAEIRRRETPVRNGIMDAEYATKAYKAETDYKAAEAAYKSMKQSLPNNTASKLSQLRREYAQEVGRAFAADPKKIDAAAVELLKSGTMKAGEYASMLDTAKKNGNATMVRIISKYAGEAAVEASKKYGETDQRSMVLRAVASMGGDDPAAAHLDTFDKVASIFNRCVNNPAIIGHWNELADPLIDRL